MCIRDRFCTDCPYGVVTSDKHILSLSEDLVLGRSFNGNKIEVENEEHSDFLKIRNFLLRDNLIDLVNSTTAYYEKCRAEMLKSRIAKTQELVLKDLNAEHTKPELFRNFNFENPDENGLRNYICYQLFNKNAMNKPIDVWCPDLLERQLNFKKKYDDLLTVEEGKYQEWAQGLKKTQEEVNHDIKQMTETIQLLQLECEVLEDQLLNGKRTRIYPEDSNVTLVGYCHKK